MYVLRSEYLKQGILLLVLLLGKFAFLRKRKSFDGISRKMDVDVNLEIILMLMITFSKNLEECFIK